MNEGIYHLQHSIYNVSVFFGYFFRIFHNGIKFIKNHILTKEFPVGGSLILCKNQIKWIFMFYLQNLNEISVFLTHKQKAKLKIHKHC